MSEQTMTPSGDIHTGTAGETRFHVGADYHTPGATHLGFWVYLMTDTLIFASLFLGYAVLGRNYAAGPTGVDVLELPLVAVNTAILLLSSITYGFSILQMQQDKKGGTMFWLVVTGLLGMSFVGIEIHEFAGMIAEGNGPWVSGFLSSFFTLVATHGTHVTFGIIWMITLLIQVGKFGLTPENKRRLFCLSMFWHFLDVVWIGVFTFVYLMGVLK